MNAAENVKDAGGGFIGIAFGIDHRSTRIRDLS
jgi:hypothetical protein